MFAQLQRASLSVQLNIAEGYPLRSKPRRRNHLVVAFGSAIETVELLEMIRDSECVPNSVVAPMLGKANETCALLLGLLRHYH
jgi:four helix bundle protein